MLVRLDGIEERGHSLRARVTLGIPKPDGTVKEKAVTLQCGDSLEDKISKKELASLPAKDIAWLVEEINAQYGHIEFSKRLRIGEQREV